MREVLLSILIMLISGCSGNDEIAKPNAKAHEAEASVGTPDDPSGDDQGAVPQRPGKGDIADPLDRKIQVTDDKAQIAEVRALFEKEIGGLFGKAIGKIEKGEAPDSQQRLALAQQKEQAKREFERILTTDGKATDSGKATAAYELMKASDASGESFLFQALRSDKPALRASALEMLDRDDVEPDFKDQQNVKLALGLIDDPDPKVAAAAAQLCANKRLAGTEAKLVALLETGKAKDPRKVAMQLAQVAKSPETIALMLSYLLKQRTPHYDTSIGYALERLVKDPDPSISEPVRAAFLEFTRGYQGKDRYDAPVIHDLARVADRSTIPDLEQILAKAQDPESRIYAIEILARLEPETAVERLLGFMSKEGISDRIVGELSNQTTGEDAETVIAFLIDPGREDEPRWVSLASARLLFEKLGSAGKEALETVTARLTPEAKMWLKWKSENYKLSSAIDELRRAKILPLSKHDLLAKMNAKRKTNPLLAALDESDPASLDEALRTAGIVARFDPETDGLPCRHDHLILNFADHTSGKLHIEAVVQSVLSKKQIEQQSPYSVAFVYNNWLYRFDAENYADWCDVESVVRALNSALETAGRKEQFLALPAGDQSASFVFADPELFLPIATKYGFPVAQQPAEPTESEKD